MAALVPFLRDGDQMAEELEILENELQQVGKFGDLKLAKIQPGLFGNLHRHSPLSRVYLHFGRKVRDYKVVTATRNPWDRAVSEFYFNYNDRLENYEHFDQVRDFFLQYLKKSSNLTMDRKIGSWFLGNGRNNQLSQIHLCRIRGKMKTDFVIKYENLASDLLDAGKFLSLDRPLKLPEVRIKSGIRPRKRHWSEMYDLESREIVARCCQNEIELYGYKFEG